MKHTSATATAITLAALMPTVLLAQESVPPTMTKQASVNANATASAATSVNATVPSSFSAEGRTALQSLYTDASARGFSTTSMANLVAEGQAKGASEATILKAASAKHAQLVATHNAMVRAGRSSPSSDEVERGSNVMARGATAAQIEMIVKKAPAERSLTVAFEVLTELTTKGVPVNNALAQVQGKLEQRASDASLRGLGATVGGTVGGTVTGAVGGVIRKP